MKPELIAKYLQDQGVGSINTSIFVHSMEAACTKGVLIRLPLVGVKIDHYLPGYYNDDIQVIVRAQTHQDGDALAKQVTTALTLKNHQFFEGPDLKMTVKWMLPRTLPIVYRRSDGNGLEWSIAFCCACVVQ